MRLSVVSPALDEIAEIAMRYLSESPLAAKRFFEEFDRVKALIRSNPHLGKPNADGSRRFTFRHFPFDIVYEIRSDAVVVTAVAHHSRKPGFWTNRLR